ncbi:MAG: BlaI/MecI/CopY family transcriptional regulator [Dehalococcoidia bacterium]
MTEDLKLTTFRPDRPGIRKVLGDLEADVMEFVWAKPVGDGTTVRDVFEPLYARRRIAYTSVMNTMTRLAKKNVLRALKDGPAYVYFPTVTQDEFVSRFVGRMLEDLLVAFSGATATGIRSLSDPIAAERARELLAEIARRRAAEESA